MQKITQTKQILQKRLEKLAKHHEALSQYKEAIDAILVQKNIYDPFIFNTLNAQERAFFDAYLKRFSAIQDFLGAKVFAMALEIAGIPCAKMSEVLYAIEKEGLIDSLEHWIELREVRNELEHDYPEELTEALKDLRYCIDSFETLERYYFGTLHFVQKYL